MLAELEVLIGELEQLCGWSRILLLEARITRAGVLIEGRPAEAQAEAEDVLRELMLIKHLTEVWQDELVALICLGEALCTQERYAEAEAIARGHLPRAEKLLAASMHRMLIRSLSGQGRHEEALAECRRALTELLPSASGDLELATAVALHGLGHHQEAEAEALRGLAACERHLHPTHPRVGEIKELLARITSD
ncbi:tetratricopeptide repeat protein [Streptomyces xanthophaeus]|uniref:tetratricopeptide repeat protein n=1 Tax=Streptomyces xanthophaeus TaxID=67385 RepID=UPI000AFD8D18|nr:tetratricopeptide repeat protein [Streptomyces xanthophaeus]